jgi:hypothetical protein
MLYNVNDVANWVELDPWTVRRLIGEFEIDSVNDGPKQLVSREAVIQLCDAIQSSESE